MRFLIERLFNALRSGFWFTPVIMGIAGIGLAVLCLELDRSIRLDVLGDSPLLGEVGTDGVRAVLSVVAGGMMTVTSLIVSLTFVALTMLSGQLGPRILLSFLRERATKLTVGYFIGTFLFALISLAASGSAAFEGDPLRLTMLVAVVLATISLLVIVMFVDHTAHAVQADRVVGDLGSKLDSAIDRAVRDETADTDASPEDLEAFKASLSENGSDIRAKRSGYLQAADHRGLVEYARQNDAKVQVYAAINSFIYRGQVVARVETDADSADWDALIDGALVIGDQRVPSQHANFELDALVEVALRALSPGINDPFTASAATEQLGAALTRAVEGVPLRDLLQDEDGAHRLLRPIADLSFYIERSIQPILQAARQSPIALSAISDALDHLHRSAARQADREIIERYQQKLTRVRSAILDDSDD